MVRSSRTAGSLADVPGLLQLLVAVMRGNDHEFDLVVDREPVQVLDVTRTSKLFFG